MKKFFLLFFIALTSFIQLYGWEGVDLTLEARVSYFRPFAKRVRKIYGDGWANYEVQATQTFCNSWTIWESAGGWPVTGHSTGLHNSTKMRLMALKLGLMREFFLTPYWRVYFGLGASYNFFNINDRSHYVRQHFSDERFGGIAQGGIYYFIKDHCFVDLNFEYLYQKFQFRHHRNARVPRRDLNLCGLQFGGGIGILF